MNMRKLMPVILIAYASIAGLMAQDETTQSMQVQVSTDSVLLGNYFEIRFTASNIKGTFEPPGFEDFDIVGGPNQSTSMRIINGVSTQSASYSYFIRPKTTGLLHIEPAYFISDEKNYETPPIDIWSLPNPDGVVQESRIEDDNDGLQFGRMPFLREVQPPRKKLKVTKI